MKSFFKFILYIMIISMLLFILHFIYESYKEKFFNEFNKAELTLYLSKFSRDRDVQYTPNVYSYRITSDQMNDATLYKRLEVEPNTVYKVSCMVKTQDVKAESELSESGAHISIIDTAEKSKSVVGTTDWQKITLYFNSYARKFVDIGFRLGGYKENCTGTAWFSDFKVEKGVPSNDTTWNFACFIIPNTDVIDVNGVKIKKTMTENDIYNTKLNMQRFQKSCNTLSGGLMNVTFDIYEINDVLKSVSYDESNGNYVAGKDVSNIIEPYLKEKSYDHIFIVCKLEDINPEKEINQNDWLGLGGMSYEGIGFSNIKILDGDVNRIYEYNGFVNTFPEEVFIHEFLHDLERISKQMNFDIPDLHAYKEYGYKNEAVIGQKTWYSDYLCKKIKSLDSDKLTGLNPEVFKIKPPHESNFQFSLEIRFIKEPDNIIEEISQIFKKNYDIIMVKNQITEVSALSKSNAENM